MKKILGFFVFMLLILTTLPVFGQINTVNKKDIVMPLYNSAKWMKTFDDSENDCGYSVLQTNDGGYMFAGSTSTISGIDYRLWIIKTDYSGDVEFHRKFDKFKDIDLARSIKQTKDDCYIIAGHTSFFGPTDWDCLLVKIDRYGKTIWNKTYDFYSSDNIYDLVEMDSGGYAMAGWTNKETGMFVRDFLLVRTDENGNYLWHRTYGGISNDEAFSMDKTSDGGIVIAGSYQNSENFNFCLIKYDDDGNLIWERQYDKYRYDFPRSVKETTDNGFIIAGKTENPVLDENDVWLIKTDSQGILEWDKIFDVYHNDIGNSVDQTSDGGYIIGGTAVKSLLNTNGFLIKTNNKGVRQWIKTYSYSKEDKIKSVQQTTDNGFVFTGTSNSNFWLMKTDSNGDGPRARSRNILIDRISDLFPNLLRILRIFNIS